MTEKELRGIRPINSKILVRIDRNNDEILLEDGNKLFLETKFHKERNAPVTGEVIAVPEFLNCRKDMDWETEMELEVGMRVWWQYLDTIYALETVGHSYKDENGHTYLLIPYASVVCAKKGDNVLCVNGFMLCEPVTETFLKSVSIILPEHIRQDKSAKFAILRHQGKRNTWYRVSVYHDHHESVLNGSVIVFSKHSDIPLEYDIHQSLDGRNKTYYRMQWPDIMAVVPQELLSDMNLSV